MGTFQEDWGKVVHGIPIEMLKELALTVGKFATRPGFGGTSIGNSGYKSLHFAAIIGNLKLYAFISEKVEDKLPKDKFYDDTPLAFACKYGHIEIVKYIIQSIDMNGFEDSVWPFFSAAKGGHLKIYRYLEDHCQEQKFNEHMKRKALGAAALNGHLDVFKHIIDSFGNINLAQTNVLTPLHLAASQGHLNICKFILSSQLSIKNPKTGETPLHSAAEFGHLEVFQYIAGYYNDMNPKKINGITPLHEAAINGHVEVCKHILPHVKDKNPISKNGEPLLHIVAKLIVRLNFNKDHFEVYKCISEYVDDKNPSDKFGVTPLQIVKNLPQSHEFSNYILGGMKWKNGTILHLDKKKIEKKIKCIHSYYLTTYTSMNKDSVRN